MNKNLLIFLATFAASALVTLAIRAARHDAYASPPPAPAVTPAPEHQHTSAAAEAKPVNTVCAICGMKVNPKLGTALYQGKVIGFGCKSCPAKFAADPDRYGPAALEGRVVEEP